MTDQFPRGLPDGWWLVPALLGGLAGWVALGRCFANWMGWI
jgi:hypothetical protein